MIRPTTRRHLRAGLFRGPRDRRHFIGLLIGGLLDFGLADVGAGAAIGAADIGAGLAAADVGAGLAAADVGATALYGGAAAGAEALGAGAAGAGLASAADVGATALYGGAEGGAQALGVGAADVAGGLGSAASLAGSLGTDTSAVTAAPGVTGALPATTAPVTAAPGVPTLGSAAGAGIPGGAATPATAVGPSLGAGFSPGAASGADTAAGLSGQLTGDTSSFTGLVNDTAASTGFNPAQTTAALQGSEASPAASSTIQNAEFGINSANQVPALASSADQPGWLSQQLENLGIGGGKGDWISPLTAGKTLLGLGTAAYDLSKPGVTALPGYGALNSQANTLGAQGQQLSSYVNNGTLPPGAQAAVDQATQQAIATIRSKYASMGQSGSTAEAEAVAGVQQQSAAEGFSIANQLLQSGISESGLASQIYQTILQTNVAQNDATIQAISGLAGALGGGGAQTVRIVGS